MDFDERWVKAGRTGRVGLKKAGWSLNPELWRRLVCGLLSAAEVSSARAPSCLPRCPSRCSGCGRSQCMRPPRAPPPHRPAAIGAPPPAGGTTCSPTAALTEIKPRKHSEVYFTSQQPGLLQTPHKRTYTATRKAVPGPASPVNSHSQITKHHRPSPHTRYVHEGKICTTS